jgi:hypothetical protein
MSSIEFQEGAVSVDARLIAEGLSIDPVQVQPLMRAGRLTSLCEQGIGEDAGRFRLSFFHRRKCLQLVVDTDGNVVQRTTLHIQGRAGAAHATRAGGAGSAGA